MYIFFYFKKCIYQFANVAVTINPIPRFGNMLGGTPVYVKTLVPTRNEEDIHCLFDNNEVVMRRVNEGLVVCVSPPSDREKEVSLRLTVGQRQPLKSQFFYSKF